MGLHNKMRKRNVKRHHMNVAFNDVEWCFLQSLKESGVSMVEYIRTTMKATPRYQEYLKILYSTQSRDEAIRKATPDVKPILPKVMEIPKHSEPTASWNSIGIETGVLRRELTVDGKIPRGIDSKVYGSTTCEYTPLREDAVMIPKPKPEPLSIDHPDYKVVIGKYRKNYEYQSEATRLAKKDNLPRKVPYSLKGNKDIVEVQEMEEVPERQENKIDRRYE